MSLLTAAMTGGPAALQSLTLGIQGAGTSLGVLSALRSGDADAYSTRVKAENFARSAEARAEGDTFNAAASRQLATSELQRAGAGAEDFRRLQGSRLASRRAVTAASGLAMEGSPLMVDESIFQNIDFGAGRLGFEGDINASRLRNQASLLDFSATRERESAGFARTAGEAAASSIKSASLINALGAGLKGGAGIMQTLSTRGGPGWGTTSKAASGPWFGSSNKYSGNTVGGLY